MGEQEYTALVDSLRSSYVRASKQMLIWLDEEDGK